MQAGQFLGPARVLATETHIDIDNESIRPRGTVWLVSGGRIIATAPEHLREASEREAALKNLVTIPT